MQAIILAAGMGKRLKELTSDNTKCMIKVNDVPLINRTLEQLDRLELDKIIIVVGYKGQNLIGHIESLDIRTPIEYIHNDIYDKTNNIYSLYLAKDELLKNDTLLLESDLIFEDGLLELLIDDPRPTLALVDKYESWMDGTVVKIDAEDRIREFVPGKEFIYEDIPEYYKTVNIYKFSKDFSANHYVPFLEAYSKALGRNEYYEQVLKVIALVDDSELRAKRLNGEAWYEIDDIQDLDIAESIFSDPDSKIDALLSRFGGYWRYPKLLDFCYLVNPFYPPQRLMDEMAVNFETLVTEYPSGMRVNSLLAAKYFGVPQENIVVGNGAAELIKAAVSAIDGPYGFIRPTFEEYPNRKDPDCEIAFVPDGPDFSYGVDDIEWFFDNKGINALVLINPDNPSGNYIPRKDVLRLADWCSGKGIHLIYDESFLDFADEEDATLIDISILDKHPEMIVIKSISKSHGVPGIRLGIAASGSTKLIACMKKDVSIWNINSFGEFYLQIAEKYTSDFRDGLRLLREERKRFASELEMIEGLRPIHSQANYIMVELENGQSARDLAKRLLNERMILVKDLSGKVGGREYLRLAVRSKADNDALLEALKDVLG